MTTHDIAGTHADVPPVDDGVTNRRPGVVTAGLMLTYLAAATIPWTGLSLGGLSIGEVALFLAAVTLVVADLERPLPKLPPWVYALALAILIIGVANQYFPPSGSYLAQRYHLDGTGPNGAVPLPNTATLALNLSVMIHLSVRIVMLPFVFGLAYLYDRRALFRSMMAFVAGVVVCALIAFTDSRGLTAIGPKLTGIVVFDRRASGLTNHPNDVGLICVLALPFAFWQAIAARGRNRALAVFGLLVLLLGLYASRSRSAAGAAAIAGIVSLGWLPQYRRHLPTVGVVLTLIAGALFSANPGLGSELLSGLRLTGGDTAGSALTRSVVNNQASRDFHHSPLKGIGLEVASEAHIIYLQALAVGGLILLVGVLIYQGGALVRSARLARVEPLAIPLFAAFLGEAIFNFEQNTFTPAIAYLASSVIAVLPLTGFGTSQAEP